MKAIQGLSENIIVYFGILVRTCDFKCGSFWWKEQSKEFGPEGFFPKVISILYFNSSDSLPRYLVLPQRAKTQQANQANKAKLSFKLLSPCKKIKMILHWKEKSFSPRPWTLSCPTKRNFAKVYIHNNSHW